MKISADASLSYFSYFYLWRRQSKKYCFLYMHPLVYVLKELIVCIENAVKNKDE
jgi:hypothetical protein